MFKLIVLAFAISGTNGQPVVLNPHQMSIGTTPKEQIYFYDESECKEQGQAYVDSMSGFSDVRVIYSCIKVK